MALLAIACPFRAHAGVVRSAERVVTWSACGHRHQPHKDEGFPVAPTPMRGRPLAAVPAKRTKLRDRTAAARSLKSDSSRQAPVADADALKIEAAAAGLSPRWVEDLIRDWQG